MFETLKDLEKHLDARGALFNGRAARRERCAGNVGPFAEFAPCRCEDCAPVSK